MKPNGAKPKCPNLIAPPRPVLPRDFILSSLDFGPNTEGNAIVFPSQICKWLRIRVRMGLAVVLAGESQARPQSLESLSIICINHPCKCFSQPNCRGQEEKSHETGNPKPAPRPRQRQR